VGAVSRKTDQQDLSPLHILHHTTREMTLVAIYKENSPFSLLHRSSLQIEDLAHPAQAKIGVVVAVIEDIEACPYIRI
jgi:hypothetical protein